MTTVVWKYELQPGTTPVSLPAMARVVAVGPVTPGADGPALWVQLNPQHDREEWRFRVVGTGDEVPVGGIYVGSAWCGPFMWHVYETLR